MTWTARAAHGPDAAGDDHRGAPRFAVGDGSQEDRRSEILRASLDLFANSGFHGTSVRQIARAVGVNEATLYHYFPSKDAILEAVFAQVQRERRLAFHTAAPELAGAPVEAVLLGLGRAFLQQAGTPLELKLTRLMMSEGPRLSTEGRQAFERVNQESMQQAIDLFRRLMEARQVRLEPPIQPDLLVMSFFAPLILWKQCHAMGQKQEDDADGQALLRHQAALLARALQPER